MSLLRANELKVYLSDGATLTDVSESIRSFNDSPLSLESWTASTHALYLGFRHKFNHRYVKMGTLALAGASMVAEYYTGSTWEAFTEFTDETNGFSASGFLVWGDADGWVSRTPGDLGEGLPDLYWVKLTLTEDIADPFSIEAIKFLLSDDRALKVAFPGIENYLPAGQSDFLPQHELAKDAIVIELKIAKKISYPDQIKNPDDWMMAATYKAIEIILDPIYGDERLNEIKRSLAEKAQRYLATAYAAIDTDKSGTLEPVEDPESKSQDAGSTSGWVNR